MTPCPTDDVLGALVQRALDEREAEQVASHLDECESCRQLVVAAVRAGVAAPAHRPVLAEGTPTEGSGGGDGAAAAGPDRSGPAAGDRVGRYQIRRLLGSGGMGRVYEAFDPELDRAIALKVMRPELTQAASVLAERLVRESRLMAKVVHPSVIAVHDVGRTGDAVFIAMDLVRGETLGAYVRRARPAWRAIVELLVRAGQGLAAAHANGIIHRDFKPDNVLVELDGDRVRRVVVTDFGVARAFADELDGPRAGAGAGASDPALTLTGAAIGTPAYMGPEQLDGEVVDHRADVFAFAVTAWELLLGARPFEGNTAAALRIAMGKPPVPPRGHAVPARVIRVVARGLAVAPADRWPDLDAFLRVLAGTARTRRTQVAVAAVAGLALIGVGLAGSRVLSASPEDPCRGGLAALDDAIDAPRVAALWAALGSDPATAKGLARLGKVVADWRTVHGETCRADAEPIQPAKTAACLDARRLEIAAFVDDASAGGPGVAKHADMLIHLIGDPSACRDPASGLLAARVPADPALRRRVTAARFRLFDAEEARDRGDYRFALDTSRALVAEAAGLWPPLHAEALYLLATSESYGGDNKQGMATLREAAALAERVHHDRIAAQVWLQLAVTAAFDAGDPVRSLEYVTYASAAIDRIGRPPSVTTMLEYTHANALIENDRLPEAEPHMRRAYELAEQAAPEHLPEMIQGLGIVYEEQGKFLEAVDAYRRALAKLAERGPAVPATEVIIRGRLALALSTVGQGEEAETVGREAVRLAERSMSEDNLDRSIARIQLAQILGQRGKHDEALAEARAATAEIARTFGERSERYGEALSLVATLLSDSERYAESVKTFARACDVIAFGTGEGTSRHAECWLGEAGALIGADRHAEAAALTGKAIPVLQKAYGDRHPQVANAYGVRGQARFHLGHPGAIADLERAHELFSEHTLDPGHLAAVRWSLGRALWRKEPERARSLVEQAVAAFRSAAGTWAAVRREAEAWLVEHPAR